MRWPFRVEAPKSGAPLLLKKPNVGFVDSEPCGDEGAPSKPVAVLGDCDLDGAPRDMADPGFHAASTAEPLLLGEIAGLARC